MKSYSEKSTRNGEFCTLIEYSGTNHLLTGTNDIFQTLIIDVCKCMYVILSRVCLYCTMQCNGEHVHIHTCVVSELISCMHIPL